MGEKTELPPEFFDLCAAQIHAPDPAGFKEFQAALKKEILVEKTNRGSKAGSEISGASEDGIPEESGRGQDR